MLYLKVLPMTRLLWPTRLMQGSLVWCFRAFGLRVMSKVLFLMRRAGALVLSRTQLPPMASCGEA